MTDDTQSAVLTELRQAIREAGVKRTTPRLYAAVMAFDADLRQPTQSDALKVAVEAERERCAQIAESIISADQYDTMDTDCYQDTANRIAAAIRANPPMPYDEVVAYVMAHGKFTAQSK